MIIVQTQGSCNLGVWLVCLLCTYSSIHPVGLSRISLCVAHPLVNVGLRSVIVEFPGQNYFFLL